MRHQRLMRWVLAAAAALALAGEPAWIGQAEAGYSSGRSSVSRSRSSSSSSSRSRSSSSSYRSSSSSSRSGSSYSPGKGTSYSGSKSTGTFGSAAAAAKRQESSQRSFPSNPPRVVVPQAQRREARDRQVQAMRSQMDTWRYSSRGTRQQQAFGTYMGRPYTPYRDTYSPWFWLWLLDRPHYQAPWLYHHRDTMDPARYEAVVRENAALRQQVADLEKSGTPRDPTYVPPDLGEADLMYDEKLAAAATQPAGEVPLEAELPPLEAEGFVDVKAVQSGGEWPDGGSATQSPTFYPSPQRDSGVAGIIGGVVVVAVVGGIIALFSAVAGAAKRAIGVGGVPGGDRFPRVPPVPNRSAAGGGPVNLPPPLPARVDDNPLGLEIGQEFSLDVEGFTGTRYRVEQVLHYATAAGGRMFEYTAYWGVARPAGDERVAVQLRVERLDGGGLAVLAMRLHDQLDYSEEFYNIVARDNTGLFQITDDDTGEVTAEYYRPEGVLDGYTATVVARNAPGEAGVVRRMQYWDYSRSIEIEGRDGTEYLIVEMEEGGNFRILLGPEIEPDRVVKQ